MKFTQSKDNLPRANVHLKFRVGADTLRAAAAEHIWTRMVNEGVDDTDDDAMHEAAQTIASSLTRATIERGARTMLERYGYSFGEALSDDTYRRAADEAAAPVIVRLYPEVAEVWNRQTMVLS